MAAGHSECTKSHAGDFPRGDILVGTSKRAVWDTQAYKVMPRRSNHVTADEQNYKTAQVLIKNSQPY